MLQKKYALVERSYDKTKAVAFIDYVEGDDFQYGLAIFEFARENYPYKYPSPYGMVVNYSCATFPSIEEMKENGWRILK